MARGYGNRHTSDDKREPQNALSGRKLQDVVRAIQSMKEKQIALAKQPFEMHELLDLFVAPEHHSALRYVYDLVEPSGLTSSLFVRASMEWHIRQHVHDGKGCHMRFSWYGAQPGGFYVPYREGSEERYAVNGPLHGIAQEKNVEKYEQVEQDLLDIQCRFALCERVVRNLNAVDCCKTLPQMRYVWPAIQILLQRAGYKDDAAAIAEPSARAGDKAYVPPETAKYLKETNDTIVRALMLDETETPDTTDGFPVSYYLDDNFKIFN